MLLQPLAVRGNLRATSRSGSLTGSSWLLLVILRMQVKRSSAREHLIRQMQVSKGVMGTVNTVIECRGFGQRGQAVKLCHEGSVVVSSDFQGPVWVYHSRTMTMAKMTRMKPRAISHPYSRTRRRFLVLRSSQVSLHYQSVLVGDVKSTPCRLVVDCLRSFQLMPG